MNGAHHTPDEGRRAHNAHQAEVFDHAVDYFIQPVAEDVHRRLARIVAAARLARGAAVLDVGTGTGVLIPHLQRAGAGRIVACDLSERMLAHARELHDPAVRFMRSDIVDLPQDTGPFDAIFLNAVFGNLYDQGAALRAAVRLLAPGGRVLISHPMGRAWHRRLGEEHPELRLRGLPDAKTAPSVLATSGLQLVELADEPDLYLLVALPGSGG